MHPLGPRQGPPARRLGHESRRVCSRPTSPLTDSRAPPASRAADPILMKCSGCWDLTRPQEVRGSGDAREVPCVPTRVSSLSKGATQPFPGTRDRAGPGEPRSLPRGDRHRVDGPGEVPRLEPPLATLLLNHHGQRAGPGDPALPTQDRAVGCGRQCPPRIRPPAPADSPASRPSRRDGAELHGVEAHPDRVCKRGSIPHLHALPLRPPGVDREASNGSTAT